MPIGVVLPRLFAYRTAPESLGLRDIAHALLPALGRFVRRERLSVTQRWAADPLTGRGVSAFDRSAG
jgi:hypothetical protein